MRCTWWIVRSDFFQERQEIFQDNCKPHTTSMTTAWLCRRPVKMLSLPACRPDLLPTENIWHFLKHTTKKIQQCWAVKIIYARIPLPKLQELALFLPKCYIVLLEEEHTICYMVIMTDNFLRHDAAINFEITLFF